MPRVTWRRLLALAGGALLLALVLPFVININRFHRQVRQTLEAEFGRRVSLGAMSLRLLPSLGIDAEYVTVEEDPAFGAEPFIRAEKLACDVAPWRLWKGRVEFSRLAFTRPSINLVKNADGRWNLAAFLEHAGARSSAGVAPRATFSSLVLDDARFNFKVRDEKKVYGLVDTDARLQRAAQGRWKLELEGTPFRSDRALTEAGTLQLRGELGPLRGAYGELPFELRLRVEKAQLADLLVLFLGREYGVLGRVQGEAQLAGTPRSLRVEGTAEVGDIHRWDLLAPPRAPIWRLRYRLAVDAATGTARLDALEAQTTASRFQATGSFLPWSTPPKWEIHFAPLELALPDLWGIYAAFRKAADPAAETSGAAGGALTWSGPEQNLVGSLDWQGAALRTKWVAAGVELARFRTDFSRDRANLKSLSVVFRSARAPVSARESMDLSASWVRTGSASSVHVQITSRSLRLEQLTALARAVGLDFSPGSELSGAASFALDFRGPFATGAKLVRHGWAELRAAELRSTWLNETITIPHARMDFAGTKTRVASLTAVVAGANISGSLACAGGPLGTWEFTLAADQLAADRLDQLLNPRRSGGLPLGVSLPAAPPRATTEDFFSQLRAKGQISVEHFRLGGLDLENLQAQANYNERHVRLEKLAFAALDGRFSGQAQLDFVNPPGYRLAGQFDRASLSRLLQATGRAPSRYAGLFSARGQLETTGVERQELLETLVGRGAFIVEEGKVARFNLRAALGRAAGLPTGPPAADGDTEVHSLSGEFFVGGRSVRLKNAVLVVPGASASLEGVADLEGRLNLALRAEPLPTAAGAAPSVEWPPEIFDNRYRVAGTLGEPEVRRAEAARTRR